MQDAEILEKVRSRLFASKPAVTRIGRFVVLEQLGRGAMGAVYAAYDEQLDRKIAIKVLLADELPSKEYRARFVREAQALARLSHPNVVTVHEVGDSEGELFLAMEFVRGQTIGDWLRTGPRWEKILEAFEQAGRGLVAAHEAGLIHRDLKPQNLMRADDGTVKVADFGLVRMQDAQETEPVDHAPDSFTDAPVTTTSLTIPGTMMGTPAYMSPEQMQGHELDARSDQFSYCVALFEGLYGRRPHPEASIEERLSAVVKGHMVPLPRGSAIPSWIHQAIVRGLAPDPEARWPSMHALLHALSQDPRHRRNRRLLGVTAVGMLGLAGAGLMSASPRTEPCTGAPEHLDEIWDAPRAAEVEAAILGVDQPHAPTVWDRTRRELDDYASDWVAMHTEACEASAVRGEQSAQLLDLRMTCLDRAMLDLRATVDTLSDADTSVVNNAHKVLAGLPPLSRCADVKALTADVEPPLPREAEAVDAVRFQLALARTARKANRIDRAQSTMDQTKRLLEGVEYGPVRMEVLLEDGHLLERTGKYDASEAVLGDALEHAIHWKQERSAHRAAVALMRVIGRRQRRPKEALQHRFLAQGLSEGHPAREASLRYILSAVLTVQSRYEDAEAEARAALALQQSLAEPNQLSILQIREQLVSVMQRSGTDDQTERNYRELVALKGDVLGPEHPSVLNTRVNLAQVLSRRQKYAEAKAEMLEIFPKLQQAYPPEHPQIALMLALFGNIYRGLGDDEAAEAAIHQSLSIRKKLLGPEHPDIAHSHQVLGNFYRERGRHEEARAELHAALSIYEKHLDPNSDSLAITRMTLAYLLVSMDRLDDALPLAEQTWDVCSRSEDMSLQADSAFVLAQALWGASGPRRDRDRARRLAEDAHRWYGLNEDAKSSADDVRQWLDAHTPQ